jgi:hypothetical protein
VCPDPSQEERNAADYTRRHDNRRLAMSGLVRIAAWAVVIGVGLWLFGGFVLRAGGALSPAAGLLIAASTGSLAAAVVAALGGIAWLSGHWLFAVRNHYCRSPLARRVFLTALPRSFDPTRRWGLPNIPPEHRR